MFYVAIGLLGLYVAGLFALSFWSRARVDSLEDYLVAGRRLSLPLASMTLFGTWFGAATMLTAADEVSCNGLSQIALEPVGSGVCLILAGLLLARPLSQMKLLTLPDFFRKRFGTGAELLAAAIMVPSYFGWIAVQFLALAGILESMFGVPFNWGLLLVAVIGTAYTYMGGMWSVTLTDALQVGLLLAGLLLLGTTVLWALGDGSAVTGWTRIQTDLPPQMLEWFSPSGWSGFSKWANLFLVAALGNLAAQDLTQRLFSARTPEIARQACWISATGYLSFGAIPVLMGLAAPLLLPGEAGTAVVPALAAALLSPLPALVFLLAVVSAILSTIDSAILAPASILSENVARHFMPEHRLLLATRLAVVLVAAFSLGFAFYGEDAFRLLEHAYTLPMVGLVAPLLLGIHYRVSRQAALASVTSGTGLWLLHYLAEWESFLNLAVLPLPAALVSLLLSFAIYFVVAIRTGDSPLD